MDSNIRTALQLAMVNDGNPDRVYVGHRTPMFEAVPPRQAADDYGVDSWDIILVRVNKNPDAGTWTLACNLETLRLCLELGHWDGMVLCHQLDAYGQQVECAYAIGGMEKLG